MGTPSQNRNDAIDSMLEHAEGLMHHSALLLAYSARQAALDGDSAGAKRFLKKAKRIDPELEIYERIELSLRPAKGNWWRW